MQSLQTEIYAHVLELQRLGYLRSGLTLEQGDNHLLFLLQSQDQLNIDAAITGKPVTYRATIQHLDGEIILATYTYTLQLSPAHLALCSIELSCPGYTQLFVMEGEIPPAFMLIEDLMKQMPQVAFTAEQPSALV
jgi:hypothetical protein